jgi:trk system potassium uptake protein TrkH
MISERGARIAFVFLMLFLISLALVMIALSATGIAFTHSLTLAVAAMANVGPAILTLEDGTTYRSLSPGARWILCAAMIVGRMEALVLIALLNPAYWRR